MFQNFHNETYLASNLVAYVYCNVFWVFFNQEFAVPLISGLIDVKSQALNSMQPFLWALIGS